MNQAINVIDMSAKARESSRYARSEESVLVFSGHNIDMPDRRSPRFPGSMEPLAKARIREAVMHEFRKGWIATGIASGGSGGDILFHEVCAELGVRSEMFLAFPPDEFIEKWLVPAGEEWVERFVRLADAIDLRVLPAAQRIVEVFPDGSTDDLVWQRCNQWMLKTAMATSSNVTLIALWDGGPEETAAGTGYMVEEASSRGARTVILDTREIFGLH